MSDGWGSKVSQLNQVGGAIYVIGRAPMAAGAIIGFVIVIGGFGAAYGWSQIRNNSSACEVAMITFVGTLPGFLLQRIFQRKFARRTDESK